MNADARSESSAFIWVHLWLIFRKQPREIPDGFAAAVDGGEADFSEAQRRMEGVRCGIGRLAVDLADDAFVAGPKRMLEKVVVHPTGMAASARRRCHDDAVDIHEARVARTEPQEIRAVVVGVLVEGEQEGLDGADAAGEEGPAGQLDQAIGIEPRQFLGVLVVERQHAPADRRGCRGLRGIERLYLLHEGVCYAARRSPTTASSRFARPSDIRVNGRRHSGEAISPWRHNRYLIGIGLASAKSSGNSGASGAQAARAPARSLSAKRRPTSAKRSVMTWLAARMPPSAPL